MLKALSVFETEYQLLTEGVLAALRENNLPLPPRVEWKPVPFAGTWGVGTSACFQSAAQEARSRTGSGGEGASSVPARAQAIAGLVAAALSDLPEFDRVEADQGYVNAYFRPGDYARRVLATVLAAGKDYGRGEPQGERVMVEYAQPNTHHAFHVGHLRTAVLGESLARIVDFAGFETIRATYPGDIGLSVAKCLWGYQKFHAGKEPPTGRGQWLGQVYAQASRLIGEIGQVGHNPEYEAEVRDLLRRWDAGDPEVIALWEKTRQWSLDYFDEIFRELNIRFDVYFYESEVDEPGKAIVEELIARGIADDLRGESPPGPVVVKIDEKLGLKKEKYRTMVILRSDGTTLYSTKDLALAKRKFEEFRVDRSVYVVDVRQSLHFQQVFKILELWGFKQAAKCFHLAYEMVTLPSGAMSSRAGAVVLFEDFAAEAYRRADKIILEKNPGLPAAERAQVSRQVALGAMKYALLAVDNNKVITFDWDAALNFEGQAAPYIQYAHVRAVGILEKAGGWQPDEVPPYGRLEPAEVNLISQMAQFPDVVQQAAETYKPLLVATYVFELARSFSDFYHACPVLPAEPETRARRLYLVAATRQALENALRLLGIEAPQHM